jgi:hypothetical protein
MGRFRKNSDPISDRARSLNEEIARLESQIKKLDGRLHRNGSTPKLRSTTLPHGKVSRGTPEATAAAHEPIFESVDQHLLKAAEAANESAAHYNDIGIRKYDLAAFFARIRNQFRTPSTTNPKLVSYLAAGGLQGLRPLRYEKRVARNRLIALVLLLFIMMLGIVLAFFRPG